MKTRSMIIALVILFVGSSFAHAQEQPPKADYSWLNGRWDGRLFDGGRGIINLKVVNGNQVEGYSRMTLREPSATLRPPIRSYSGPLMETRSSWSCGGLGALPT